MLNETYNLLNLPAKNYWMILRPDSSFYGVVTSLQKVYPQLNNLHPQEREILNFLIKEDV